MPQTILLMRLFENVLTAINFGVIALALTAFLQRRDVGHRTLLRMVIVFCAMVTGDNLFGAWSIFHRHREAFVLIRFGTAVYGSMCVTYFIVVNRDLVRTLRVSELWDRLRKDRLKDKEQARTQMIFASQQTRIQSEAILARSKW